MREGYERNGYEQNLDGNFHFSEDQTHAFDINFGCDTMNIRQEEIHQHFETYLSRMTILYISPCSIKEGSPKEPMLVVVVGREQEMEPQCSSFDLSFV